MVRFDAHLPESDLKALKSRAKKQGIPAAELLRQFVKAGLAKRTKRSTEPKPEKVTNGKPA